MMRMTSLVFHSQVRITSYLRSLRPAIHKLSMRLGERFGVAHFSFKQLISLALVITLLSASTPAAPRVLIDLASELNVSLAFWLRSSGWAATLSQMAAGREKPARKSQEKQTERDARVSRIQVYPGDVTLQVGERVIFAAVAYNQADAPVGGVSFTWASQDESRGRAARVSPSGEFVATIAGQFKVFVEGAGRRAQVTVKVEGGEAGDEGKRRKGGEKPRRVRKVSTLDPVSGSARDGATKSSERSSDAITDGAASMAAAPIEPIDGGGGWDDGNYGSADDPGNRVGDPLGSPADGGAGSGNFQLTAPVLGLTGRDLDLALGLSYNSRLWNKGSGEITYDIDRGWPAPGWTFGFSKVLGQGVYRGSMIVEADGTRHSYTGSVTETSYGTTFVGRTLDGSFIDYKHETGIGGVMTYAQAKYPTGVVIEYTVRGTGAMYPSRITDANGNFITITYVNNTGPQIETIIDTLGRVINFHYNENKLLMAITAPPITDPNSNPNPQPRELVRLSYRQLTLNHGFSGLTPRVREAAPWVIDAIYYPATSTGYWFGDTDSYSSYGMIAKVVEQRGMSFAASSLNDPGTITPGLMTRQQVYSYPLGPDYGLTDAPTYQSLTESWTRDGVNVDQAVTNYLVEGNASPRKVTVTLPNRTKSIQYSYNYSNLPTTDPRKALDGVIYLDETRDENDNLLQSSVTDWEPGAYGSLRPLRTTITDERGQITATDYSYEGGSYNQVTKERRYDYGGQNLLRETRTQYENSSIYTARHIFNLPKVVEVYAGDGATRVSRTEYQYDGQTLADAPGVEMHHDASNPYAPTYTVPGDCYMVCDDWCHMVCDSEVTRSDYDPSTDFRGNVTQVITYTDAANLSGPVTETRTYDITGNMVTASTSCCEQTSYGYTVATQYAYPVSMTRGSATDASKQVTTTATYDFNTGLKLSTRDANERTTHLTYFADSLRIRKMFMPTRAANASGYTTYEYDDAAMSATETTYTSGGEIANQSVKLLDGRGKTRQERALGASGVWDIVETRYDEMAQATHQSNPYRAGEQPQWSVTTYDSLGRAKSMQAADGSTTQTFFNEASRPDAATNEPGQTTRIVDAWGREKWGRADADGRVVEVVEPDPSGSGAVAQGGLQTLYRYDTSGNLVGATQGSQTRSFRYDSLGRLTHQKLAEAQATLSDDGLYLGSGTWSDVYAYDERSNIISHADARGVKTRYNYQNDPLNRLQSIDYDTTGFGDTGHPILPAASVSYGYVTTGDVTRLETTTTTGVSTESYGYDYERRPSVKTLTLTSRPNYPLVTDYSYDSLDRVTDVRYPAQYGVANVPRKIVHHDYDVASRLSGLKVDGASYASEMVYNAAGQNARLKVGASGANQITEDYGYNPQTGLLETQRVARGSQRLLDLAYDYAGANGQRTGQLVKITNNLDPSRNHDRSYSYDALGRLAQAKGGPANASLWTQEYRYDRYGNRTSVMAVGNTASLDVPGASGSQQMPTTPQLASNTGVPTMEAVRDEAWRGISDTPFTPFSSARPKSRAGSQPAFVQQPSSSLVISQVYGGGGNTGASYKNDFIELFNRGNTSVDLTGWSVQYAAPGSGIWQTTTLSGSLAPGQYYLVQEAQGAGGTLSLPTPNAADNIALNSTAGTVALVNNSTALAGACPTSASGIVDFVGYGSSAACFEGSGAAPAPSNTTAIQRAAQGCIEADNNATDFETAAPIPRNTSTAASACGVGAAASTTVVISEFRTRGSAGGTDEFIELYNKTDNPISIGGWKVKVSNNAGAVSTRVVINPNTTLPAHGHFLVTNTGAGGYSGTVAGDQTYTTGLSDDGGIAITRSDDVVVDQVGLSSGSAFRETRSLSPMTTNADRSYERKPGGAGGSTQDTNDSPSDFQARTPSEPQNLASAPTPQAPAVNQPPVANPGGPYSGTTAAAVDFNGSNSTDADGTITGYAWNFGDNTTDTVATPQHTYTSAGTYTARLTVTDNQGATATATVAVTITASGGTGDCSSEQSFTVEQFVKNFYQGALNRQPTAAESQAWINLLRQNYYQGQTQLMQSAQFLGRQLFTSNEYNNRHRTDREYVFDLYQAYLQRGPDQMGWDHWTQDAAVNGRDAVRYGFDYSPEFSQKVAALCPGSAGSGSTPIDGLSLLSYDQTSNRITTAGFEYDAAGNQTRVARADGSAQRFQYDAANRLVKVKDDADRLLQSYTYGEGNRRLISQNGDEGSTNRTYYCWNGEAVIAEYSESASSPSAPQWSKSYIHLGARLLSTITPGGTGEAVQFHHPDRLGTRLITNASDSGLQEQVTLPYGVALDGESTGASNRRFTSYDRSAMTGLDYAINRQYDSQQGRFTQVDPIGMRAASLDNPQSLNLYSYCGNDPVNRVDPDGLFWKTLKNFFKTVFKIIKLVVVAAIVAVVVIGMIMLGAQALIGLTIALAIQNLFLTIYASISEEFRERGVTFGSFFRGFGKGIAGFFKGFGVYYGNYCGPKNPNQQGGHTPIDDLDAACQAHDRVYQSTGDNGQRLRADRRLFRRALRSLLFGRSPLERFYAAIVTVIFGVFIIIRSFKKSNDPAEGPKVVNVTVFVRDRQRFKYT
jgi:RHS repeat-associated protein